MPLRNSKQPTYKLVGKLRLEEQIRMKKHDSKRQIAVRTDTLHHEIVRGL
jgi:hypothetical protein